MTDSLDLTPEQVLSEALDLAKFKDFDGALVLLFNDSGGADFEITRFVSGLSGTQLIAALEVQKLQIVLHMFQ